MKKFIALLMAACMALGLMACGSDTTTSTTTTDTNNTSTTTTDTNNTEADTTSTTEAGNYEGKLICYCPPTMADTFLASIADKVGALCKAKGMEFVTAEGEFNIATQIQQMENFIAMGADLIIAQPVDVDAYETVVGEARAQGIKVMFMADDPTYDVEGEFMSVDVVQGQLTAEMGSAWIDATFPDAGEGEILCALLQLKDRPASIARCDAIEETISADPRVKIVFEKEDLGNSTDAQQAMEECLTQYKDINLVLCFDENGAIGANSAVMADASLDKSKIAAFGANITEAGYALIEQSKTDESIVRGCVSFGEGDAYYEALADAICQILDEAVPINTPFFCDHIAVNSVGYEGTFDAQEYAASYVDL